MNKFAFAVAAAGLMTLAACNKAEEANVVDANATEIVAEDANAVDANAAEAVAVDANAVDANAAEVAPAADANAVDANVAAAE